MWSLKYTESLSNVQTGILSQFEMVSGTAFNQLYFFIPTDETLVITRGRITQKIGFDNFKERKFSYLNITALGKSVVEDSSQCAFFVWITWRVSLSTLLAFQRVLETSPAKT